MSHNDTQAADQPNLLIKKASILAPVVAQMKNHKLLASYQNNLVRRIQTDGLRPGLAYGVISVRGLMLGTAGALYALNAIHHSVLPNPLLLEPPLTNEPGTNNP